MADLVEGGVLVGAGGRWRRGVRSELVGVVSRISSREECRAAAWLWPTPKLRPLDQSCVKPGRSHNRWMSLPEGGEELREPLKHHDPNFHAIPAHKDGHSAHRLAPNRLKL